MRKKEQGAKGVERTKEKNSPFLFPPPCPPQSLSLQPVPSPAPNSKSLVTRLLLLLAEQRPQGDASHLDDLEPDTRDVADGVAAAAETGDEDLVLLVVVVDFEWTMMFFCGNGEHGDAWEVAARLMKARAARRELARRGEEKEVSKRLEMKMKKKLIKTIPSPPPARGPSARAIPL